MQLFIDTAEIQEIKSLNITGLIDGVTTNPSLIAKSGRNIISTIEEICNEVSGPVSAEVTATDFDYSLKSINSEIANLCGKHIINLNDYNFKDDHFYDGVHTTPSGSEFIGNILSDYIINNNLLINLEDY